MRALDLAAELGAEDLLLLLDSKLVVEQLQGRWRVKDAKLAPLHDEAISGLRRFRRWRARHVPRSENAVSIRLESTPGTRNHVRLLRRLWRIAEDREIAAYQKHRIKRIRRENAGDAPAAYH